MWGLHTGCGKFPQKFVDIFFPREFLNSIEQFLVDPYIFGSDDLFYFKKIGNARRILGICFDFFLAQWALNMLIGG